MVRPLIFKTDVSDLHADRAARQAGMIKKFRREIGKLSGTLWASMLILKLGSSAYGRVLDQFQQKIKP